MRVPCPLLSQLPGISHGFFTREGGVSEDAFASLNCGYGSGDNAAHVERNRFFVARALGVPAASLLTAYQIQATDVVIVEKPWTHGQAPKADALVTNVPGIGIGILTADCLPILLADAKHRVVAAVHAGWKGALGGIIESGVAAMQKLGAAPQDIAACIGPGIAQCSYEVGAEFRDRFLAESADNARWFEDSSRDGHFLFDLKGYAEKRLLQCGVGKVNILANDTCLEDTRFFSYRRACLRGEPQYGRQISAISLMS